MKKKEPKYFSRENLKGKSKEDFKLHVVQINEKVYESTVLMRKTFLGLLPRWVVVADLLKPVRDVDEEIEEAKLKLEALQAKRKERVAEVHLIAGSIQSFHKKPLPFTDKPSKSDPVLGVFHVDEGKSKDKTRSVKLATVNAPPMNKGNQQQQKKGNQNQN